MVIRSTARLLRRPWVRYALVGLLLSAGGTSIAWRLVDQRLASAARRQAEAGQSAAVVATRPDWPHAVVPVALLRDGQAGENARAAASAKLDQATRSQRATVRRVGSDVLDAIRSTDGALTDVGARWAAWAVRRVASMSSTLPPRERLDLIAVADDVLAMLGEAPHKESAPQPEPPAEQPRVAAQLAEPQFNVAPSPLPEPKQPLEFATVVAPPSVNVEAEQPEASPQPDPRLAVAKPESNWRPNWVAPPEEPREIEAPTPQTSIATGEPSAASDRDLLAELLEIDNRLKTEGAAVAVGPTPAPIGETNQLRLRADAVGAELVRRGYSGLSAGHVEALLSRDSRVRLDLAERLLTDRTTNAARLLRLLATDSSAQVRVAAISALGSSTSRGLVEEALRLATYDPDPQVGRLADAIRTRLR